MRVRSAENLQNCGYIKKSGRFQHVSVLSQRLYSAQQAIRSTHSCTMAINNAAPGVRQREITELFCFKKPKLNEQSTHAAGEPVPPTVPQSSIPTVTENDKVVDFAAAAGLGDTEVIILMSPGVFLHLT
jgi:hypothetical protein